MIIDIFLHGSQVGIQLIVVILASILWYRTRDRCAAVGTITLGLMLIKRITTTIVFLGILPEYYSTVEEIGQVILPFLISLGLYYVLQRLLQKTNMRG